MRRANSPREDTGISLSIALLVDPLREVLDGDATFRREHMAVRIRRSGAAVSADASVCRPRDTRVFRQRDVRMTKPVRRRSRLVYAGLRQRRAQMVIVVIIRPRRSVLAMPHQVMWIETLGMA